ncbi:MAG: MarR family transcriptional regulator [Gammaproteobacteria bacterium]|nr:MarR family transcriptional regulator [Gammaproteobacteria bacterium]
MLIFHAVDILQSEAPAVPSLAAGAGSAWAPANPDTEETLRAVRRIARALALSSRDLARRHDLTATQLLCLRLLREHEALSAGTLAKALSLSPQTATGLVDRLETRGLVERVRSTSDRRCVLVSLTDAGSSLIEATGPMLQDRFVARFDALEPRHRQSLRKALETVVSLLEADELDAAPVLTGEHGIESHDKTTHAPHR